MRVRTIQLRILGAALCGLWFAVFTLVVLGYRPGGPADAWVGLAAAGPILIALAAVRWPPVARGDRALAGIVWLGLGAVLLLVPSIGGLVVQLTGRGPQTLLPSLEVAYPWALALAATALYAGLGIARRQLGETALRRRRLVRGTAVGLAMAVGSGGAFASAAIANELALGNRPAIASRFGPTDPAQEPPSCTGELAAGETARLDLRMDAAADGRRTGQARIEGIRNGADIRWTGFAASSLALGQYGLARVGGDVWELSPGRSWTRTGAARALGRDLDRSLVRVALSGPNRAVAEDRGLSFIEGARARHCRITVPGATMRSALPVLELLLGGTDISRWRADLDYWVFADGQLGQADGRVTGPAAGLAEDALTMVVRFRLLAWDRGLPVTVMPPGR